MWRPQPNNNRFHHSGRKKKSCSRHLLKYLAWTVLVTWAIFVASLFSIWKNNDSHDVRDVRNPRRGKGTRTGTRAEKTSTSKTRVSSTRDLENSGGILFGNLDVGNGVGGGGEGAVDVPIDDHPLAMRNERNVSTEEWIPRTTAAYLEGQLPPTWPAVPRRTTSSEPLKKVEYPKLDGSCANLAQRWPVDDDEAPTLVDPFLPWIHDVFPTADGQFVQFVAQNMRRCNTGKNYGKIKKHLEPQVSLFQNVAVQSFYEEGEAEGEAEPHGAGNADASPNFQRRRRKRYRLSSYEDADDPDGMETRFICRFKPTGQETLSTYNFNYEYVTYRKGYTTAFTEEGFDNHIIWTSALLFRCPIPADLQSRVRDGSTVVMGEDGKTEMATLYVDLIPIRTPPRFQGPSEFLPPFYELNNPRFQVDVYEAFGYDAAGKHKPGNVVPLIEDSGRWENIPICKTTLDTYETYEPPPSLLKDDSDAVVKPDQSVNVELDIVAPKKLHNLIACTWTANNYKTRGNRARVSDGGRRLYEWLKFNFMVGFDHVYVYDNSGAYGSENGSEGYQDLSGITDLFPPSKVTRIEWPATICNNRPGNVDNKGERSSQYAAEASCRLRFGPHAKWLGSMDVDEYLVPLTNGGWPSLLQTLEQRDIRVYSLNSQRSNPRIDLMLPPPADGARFTPGIPDNSTYVGVYNCQREKSPRKNTVPAEKQVYRTDYVLHHHIHYSTVTGESILPKSQTTWPWRQRYNERHVAVSDELTEAIMIHTKTVTPDITTQWQKSCGTTLEVSVKHCKLGYPWPSGSEEGKGLQKNSDGYWYNCYPNAFLMDYWLPKIKQEGSYVSWSAVHEQVEELQKQHASDNYMP